MPIEKMEEIRNTDVDPSSVTLNTQMQKVLCCAECGEVQFTLRRAKDANGNKIKPARFVCQECYKRGLR